MTRRHRSLPALAGPLRSSSIGALARCERSQRRRRGPQLSRSRPQQRGTAQKVAQDGVAAVRTGCRTRPTLHRQARRHALGHLEAVPEEPVALARAVGHEPRADPQPAPDLSRARCCSSTRPDGRARLRVGAGRSAAPAPASSRRAFARPDVGADGIAVDPVQPDRAVPQRSRDLRDQRARERAAHRRHAGRPRAARRVATPPTCAATSSQAPRVPHLPRAAPAERSDHRGSARLRGHLRRRCRVRSPGRDAAQTRAARPRSFRRRSR